MSPSDLRRPADASRVKIVGKHEKQDVPPFDVKEAEGYGPEVPAADQAEVSAGLECQPPAPAGYREAPTTAKEATDRESSFIDAFFADKPKAYDRDLGNSKSWRQTAVQRRSAPSAIARPKARQSSIVKSGTAATSVETPVGIPITIPSSQALVDNYPYPKSTIAGKVIAEPIQQDVELSQPLSHNDVPSADPTLAQSTSEKLQKLPEDDIDFLSADEIRAAMGRRTSVTRTNQEKEQERQKLQIGYATAKPKVLDETVEAHMLNNYYVRRTEQELERAQIAADVGGAKVTAPTQMESSIDRMRRWIEEGGTSLAKHFWQDPIEAGAPSEADMQFAKQMAGLTKGRHAREHISDDLETDLPMCKGLLERLKNDENRVEHAVFLLRSPRKAVHGAEISKNLRTIRERRLRNTYERTEKQFEIACQSLRDLKADELQKATTAFKRRLGIASRILHKNHTLTRMLTWSAQARLDEPDLERGKAELYSEISTRLATLRDTQMALARLMDHAVQTYRVSLEPADEALSRQATAGELGASEATAEDESALSRTAGAKFLTDTAAAARLTDEIQSQKAAMQGLSDDGYARGPKHTGRRSFEEKNPLAHSLFRPFNLQFESLGKKTDGEEAADKLKEALKQNAGDRKLVQEVRSAYEDVYGPITVEHRQVSQLEPKPTSAAKDQKTFEVLKEDPLDVDATAAPAEARSAESVTASEPLELKSDFKDVEEVVTTAPSPSSCNATKEDPYSVTVAAAEAVNEIHQDTPSSEEILAESSATAPVTAAGEALIMSLPTHYTILVHDPQNDTMSITTSTSGPPRDTSAALPIHQALSTLKAPARFIPYITPGLEVVTAKRHMLVLRNALDEAASTRGFETIGAQPSADVATEAVSSHVNPIDGTSRLSPTGYSGVEQSQEQLEKDFEERRQAAAATEAARSSKSKQQVGRDEVLRKRRGGVGGVVKTAIWASAVCYIVGVTAELLR